MKKVLLLLILGGSLISCKKKPCWECLTKDYDKPSTPTTSTVCDKTEEEIRQYEKDKAAQDDNNGIVVTCTNK